MFRLIRKLRQNRVGDPISHGAYAVVTGAGSGIGREIARELARRGGTVICSDIDLARAEESARLLNEDNPGSAFAVRCDVGIREDVLALASTAVELLGRDPDLIVNNAGVGIGGRTVGAIGFEDWDWAVDINLWGVVNGCETFLPALRTAGRGGIINVASAAAFTAAPSMGPYNVSKAGVLALSETIAAELGGTDIKITVLCPTFVKTNVARDGRIAPDAAGLTSRLMALTGIEPSRVAVQVLDALDRGRLYVLPQLDANVVWRIKRVLPTVYLRGLRMAGRRLPIETT